ncbi:DUF459 domain-containing protein [Propylenella binzhouense]|nr:DUF459 domain-containing protein [Propylenella binzhouense]
MERTGRTLAFLLTALCLAAGFGPAPALAQGTTRYVIIQEPQPQRPNIFRFLFGNRRQPPQVVIQELPPDPRGRVYAPGQRRPAQQAAPRNSRTKSARTRPQRSAPAATRTAVAPPKPVVTTPKDDDAKRVLVVGDFMAKGLANGLEEAFAEEPKIVVIDGTNGSSGLVRDDYYDWAAELPKTIESEKPDAIVMMVGSNDRQPIRTDKGSLAHGGEGWLEAYGDRVETVAKVLLASDKPVFWVGLLPVRSSAMSRDYSELNSTLREKLEPTAISFVDVWNGFADENGGYVASGPDMNGQTVQQRTGDGLNLTGAGQRKLAFFVERDLQRLLLGGDAVAALPQPGAAALLGESAPGEESGMPAEAAAPAAPKEVISPMASVDVLPVVPGESLSGGSHALAGERPGKVEVVGERSSGAIPAGRVDNYAWPPGR